MAAVATSEPASCYSETIAGDDDCKTSSYVDEKDDYIDEFVTICQAIASSRHQYEMQTP